MILLMLILIILVGMLVYVILAPFSPPIFFSMGIVGVAIGIWAIFALKQAKRGNLAVKLACPPEYNQNKYSRNNKNDNNGKGSVVTFLAHIRAIIKRLTTICKQNLVFPNLTDEREVAIIRLGGWEVCLFGSYKQ